MQNHRRSLALRLSAAIPAAVASLFIAYVFRRLTAPAPAAVITEDSHAAFPTTASAALPRASRRRGSVVFTCPDGRIGLHVVHTRFLISQANAGLLFAASRLHLMETFMAPSLAAQTSLDFVLYGSHDPKLSPATVQAFKDVLATVPVRMIANGERSTVEMGMGFAALAGALEKWDPRVRHAQLFVTTRLDVDDAANVGSVAEIQRYACSNATAPEYEKQKSAGDADLAVGKGGEKGGPSSVRVMYASGGMLWFPSHDKTEPFGHLRTPYPHFKVYRNLAVMQSMVLAGSSFIKKCPLDVYGYPHYKPQKLAELPVPAGCPAFQFDAVADVYRWDPSLQGQYGWLYTKTKSSWTIDLINQRKSSTAAKMDVAKLESSFGLDAGGLAVANMMFAGFAKEAPEALEDKSKLQIER